jgi:hypothetical protein
MKDPLEFDYDRDRPVSVEFQGELVTVTLADGRRISNPLDWHPWLAAATSQQRVNIEYSPFSVYWPDLDEGLDIQGMLFGIRPAAPQEQS